MNIKNKRIVFIGAHYDDIELSCAGLINDLKYNNEIFYIIITKSASLKENIIRKKEQKKVLKQLNIKKCYFLNENDGALKNTKKLYSKIENILLNINPNICFTHYYNDTHQDHIVTSNIVTSICSRKNINLCYFDSFSSINLPYNFVYEINIEEKRKILNFFKHQLNKIYRKNITYLQKEINKNLYNGKNNNYKAAEIYLIYKICLKKGDDCH